MTALNAEQPWHYASLQAEKHRTQQTCGLRIGKYELADLYFAKWLQGGDLDLRRGSEHRQRRSLQQHRAG